MRIQVPESSKICGNFFRTSFFLLATSFVNTAWSEAVRYNEIHWSVLQSSERICGKVKFMVRSRLPFCSFETLRRFRRYFSHTYIEFRKEMAWPVKLFFFCIQANIFVVIWFTLNFTNITQNKIFSCLLYINKTHSYEALVFSKNVFCVCILVLL